MENLISILKKRFLLKQCLSMGTSQFNFLTDHLKSIFINYKCELNSFKRFEPELSLSCHTSFKIWLSIDNGILDVFGRCLDCLIKRAKSGSQLTMGFLMAFGGAQIV